MFANVSTPEPEAEDAPVIRPAGAPVNQQPLPRRKRGRPRKAEAPRPPCDAPHEAGAQQPKRKRGRPRKVPLPVADVPSEGNGEQATCTVAASASSTGLLPGSALPSLGLPRVPSGLMASTMSGSADLFTPLRRRAPQPCSCVTVS